ncbi:rotatin-like [Macrobrachium rosenbergii]|uniref:rotatin-like n=1 Tax=Macrobrachium rosenbergii TaxID=79674 RepID=UPI0034D4145F
MAEIQNYIQKLVHPIVEIRERTLNTLLQKLEFGILTVNHLVEHQELLENVLHLLNLGPHTLRKPVLKLLQYVFEDESTRSRFDALGGTLYLQSLKLVAPLDLISDINVLLQSLHHTPSLQNIKDRLVSPISEGAISKESSDFKEIDTNSLVASSSDVEEHVQSMQQRGSTSIDDSCVCGMNEKEDVTIISDSPITFSTFPWQALTNSDRRILESTAQSLMSHDESIVVASLHFLETVVLKDFPAEILLQRPAIVQAVYGCVEEIGETAWRVQGPACACLLTLTQLLNDRVSHFKDPHLSPAGQQTVTPTSSGIATPSTDITRGSCCSPDSSLMGNGSSNNVRHLGDGQDRSGSIAGLGNELSSTSVHEDDDGDEFILLGMHQLTLSCHCSHVLRVASPLLVAKRPSLQSISLRLLLSCVDLLQQCVNAKTLWHYQEEEIVNEVTTSVKMTIQRLAALLILNYQMRKKYGENGKLEDTVLNNECTLLFLCRILNLFVPVEAFEQIVDKEIVASLILVLCDGGFYLGYRTHYSLLLQYLSQVLPDMTTQVNSILFAAKSLEATATFLSTSSSDFEEFLTYAEAAIEVASIHQSSVFVEKLVRGLGKQVSVGTVGSHHLQRARDLLLKVIHFPENSVKLAGYTFLFQLVNNSVGISQAADTSQSRSSRIIILLSPSVISCLVYSGLTDDDPKVINTAQDILLGLMKGRLLMNSSVWFVAAECWRYSLIHLQCLTDTVTHLGRSVGSLVGELYNDGKIENIEVIKYHLCCLFVLDRTTRIQAMSEVVQRLAYTTTSFIPHPHEINPAVHHDVFVLRQPVQLLFSGNLSSERGRLLKVVELIQGVGVENAVRKAAWSQLAFLLGDPQLHKPFLQLFSIQYLILNFIGMLKQDGSMNVTVDFIPGALGVLRLLATHSSSIRTILSDDEEFLLCLVRAGFVFYVDEHTRSQASCLMALLLLNDVILFSTCDRAECGTVTVGGKNFISVPELLISKVHLPFICDTYTWFDKGGLCEEMRTVHQILQEEDWEVMKFFRVVWASTCRGGLENISNENDKCDSFAVKLNLSDKEISMIRLYVLQNVLEKFLLNIENGTTHHDVKNNSNCLSFHMLQFQMNSLENRGMLFTNRWTQSLCRFLTCQPNSSVDEQLLTHILNMIYVILLCQRNKGQSQGDEEKGFPLLKFLVGQFTRLDSALLDTLKTTGSVTWVASDPNPRALLSVRLFRIITNLIGLIVRLVKDSNLTSDFWASNSTNQLTANVVLGLLPVLKPNDENEPQYYNLVVLGCALECLAHVTALGWPGDKIASQLVSCLTRIIKTFHEGRGRAHNSFMGRAVTLSSSLILIHLLSHPSGDLSEEISKWGNTGGSPDWSWLVSLWVYRDPSVTSAGLTVASSLTSKPEGLYLLHESLTQVSGGVWGAALSYLLATGRSCLVRMSAAELLVKLTEKRPTVNEPWSSPIVTDTMTGESICGVEALMVLLQHCNFYKIMRITVFKLCIYPGKPEGDCHPIKQAEWDFSTSHLSSLCTAADDDQGSMESQSDEDWRNGKSTSLVSVQLYESLLRLFTNLLLLQPSQVIDQLCSLGIIHMVIKQLRYIMPLINASESYFQAMETALIFLCTVLKHDASLAHSLTRDTSLIHLIMAVLTSGVDKPRTRIVGFELLNALTHGGGLCGTSPIIEWIIASPALTLRPLVLSLHSSSLLNLQRAAASFLISLIYSVFPDENLPESTAEFNLSKRLDMPVKLLNNQDICPGWEICRHLIQLICSVSDINEIPSQTLPKKTELSPVELEHQTLLLECLKLTLLISTSAKEAAHHYRLFFMPVLIKPFTDLRVKIQTVNVHITTQLMNKKGLKELIQKVIQHLELATNWVDGRGPWVVTIGESVLPLLHSLWVPILRTQSLLTAALKFILSASTHHQVCLFLNRTSGLPGVLLSASRTGHPLLANITTVVCQQLSRHQNQSRGSVLGLKDLPRESIEISVSLLTNCARLQECTSVMIKHDLMSSIMKWLDSKFAFEEGMFITLPILKLFIVLLSHKESQMAVCKFNRWVNTFHGLLQHIPLQKDALTALANMSQNHHAARCILGSEDFVSDILSLVRQHEDEAMLKLALVIIWSLIANNKRGQAILKRFPLQPELKYLVEIHHKHASLCETVLKILKG